MSLIPANKSTNKAIVELRKDYPKANIPTEIEQHNAGAFNLLGARVVRGAGVSVTLETRVFTLGIKDFEKAKGNINAADYGWESIHILHDPTAKQDKGDKPKEDK